MTCLYAIPAADMHSIHHINIESNKISMESNKLLLAVKWHFRSIPASNN
jgi:hypothetical protein